jgi:hypothetical protein
MPVIELEAFQDTFASLVQMFASMSGIPFATLQALGPDRLINGIAWNGVVGYDGAPPAPAGGVVVGFDVSINHVSIAEVAADPNAPGQMQSATAWVQATLQATKLVVELVRLDIVTDAQQTTSQTFGPPVLLRSFVLPILQPIQSIVLPSIVAGAILRETSDEIVTLRFASSTSDSLTAPPIDLLDGVLGKNFLVRISGDFMAEIVRLTLNAKIGSTLQPGTVLEQYATATWEKRDLIPQIGPLTFPIDVPPIWGVSASFKIKQLDACPTLFGSAVDFSITLDLRFETVPSPDPSKLLLQVGVTHVTDPWDTFRCWAGSGLVVSVVVAVANGIAGLFVALASALFTAALVSDVTTLEIEGQPLAGLTPIPPVGSDDATYQVSLPIPSFPGETNVVTSMDQSGWLTSGSLVTTNATHNPKIAPTTIAGDYYGGYNCQIHQWAPELKLTPVGAWDSVSVAGFTLLPPPVKIFPTSEVVPANVWKITIDSNNQVEVVPRIADVPAGQTGTLYFHTSIGLKVVPIAPIPPPPQPPSQMALIEMELACKQTAPAMPTGGFDVHWLVDPPPFEGGLAPVRQWQVTVRQMERGAAVSITPVRGGAPTTTAMSWTATATGEAFFELCTDGDEELRGENRGAATLQARLGQRWILPRAAIELGAPALSLTRALDGTLGVLTAHRLFVVEPVSGAVNANHALSGALGLVATPQGLLAWGPAGATLFAAGALHPLGREAIAEVRRHADGRLVFHTASGPLTVERSELRPLVGAEGRATVVGPSRVPLSLTVGTEVAAIHGNRLIIGAPWGQLSADRPAGGQGVARR